MKLVKIIGISLGALALMACPKDVPKPEPAPLPEVVEEPVEEPVIDETPQVDPLEAERAKLEEMLNKLMSEDVYFDYDKSKLTTEAKDLLTEVGDILIKNDKFLIVVEGHTDIQGTENYNMALGSKRANAVRGYLVDYGVSKDIISTTSYGEQKPKVDADSDSAHAANRRANFQVNLK